MRALPEDTVDDVAQKARRWAAAERDPRRWSWRIAADLYVAAFLTPKTGGAPQNGVQVTIPTTGHVWQALAGGQVYGPLVGQAQNIAGEARAFHWQLGFPDIFERGGFDVVLGNPPWERIKLQEQEFFAARDPEIAEAPKASDRGRLIDQLKEAAEGTRERALYEEFEVAKRRAEASSVFARESQRFPLTGHSDINTYALFAELGTALSRDAGFTGLIVPAGLMTDANMRHFFGGIFDDRRLKSFFCFDNGKGIFPAIHRDTPFGLLTLGPDVAQAKFSVELLSVTDLSDERRIYTLDGHQLAQVNPNTRTAPAFRSNSDAVITYKIYDTVPVFVQDNLGETGSPWKVQLPGMFHMAQASDLFVTAEQLTMKGATRLGRRWVLDSTQYVPLFEGKMAAQYDHRAGSFGGMKNRPPRGASLPSPTFEKRDPDFDVEPWYWVDFSEVADRFFAYNWARSWSIGYRFGTNPTNERTLISTAVPLSATPHVFSLFIVPPEIDAKRVVCLLGNLNSLVADYICRLKMSRQGLDVFIVKQLPILPPSFYTESEACFVVPRVLELTYTSHSMKPFADDLGYDGPPFAWDEDRRAFLRAELDAFYARAYGLTRDELRYILDPADVKGPDYPSETFRVLKTNEIKKYGEYRTRRLVLDAWDRMERGEIAEIPSRIIVTAPASTLAPLDLAALPDGAWSAPSGGNVRDKTIVQIAAILKALPGPTPIQVARHATIYALEPRLLTPRLDQAKRSEWLRLVGTEAQPRPGVTTFGLGGATGWGEAVRLLTATGCLVEDSAAQTWSPGRGLDAYFTESWPRRALFALEAATAIFKADSAVVLSADEEAGLEAFAA